MYRLIIICVIALTTLAASGAVGGTMCSEEQHRLPAPASEVVHVVVEWLTNQGYALRQDFPRPGYIHLVAWKPQEKWEVTIRPQSALASVMMVVYEGSVPASTRCRQLREHVDGYLYGVAPNPTCETAREPILVPTAVLDHFDTVVCIRAQSNHREVQFSGFIVDPDGLILCTAHDLSNHQEVTVTFYDSERVPGTILQLDLSRDLALVDCSTQGRPFVSLATGQNLLGMGENVFSIGCPNNLRGTLASGTINGPPRLVNDQPL